MPYCYHSLFRTLLPNTTWYSSQEIPTSIQSKVSSIPQEARFKLLLITGHLNLASRWPVLRKCSFMASIVTASSAYSRCPILHNTRLCKLSIYLRCVYKRIFSLLLPTRRVAAWCRETTVFKVCSSS